MKVIIAPDKFKGTLTARRVAAIIAEEFHRACPGVITEEIPLADGGEGTVDALTRALGGTICRVTVHDPLMRTIGASFGMAGSTAVLEMSAASGLALLKEEERNPMKTTSFGTGELIRAALDAGAKEIILGIGGSATVEAGTGMAQALGAKFFMDGKAIAEPMCGGLLSAVERVELSGLDPRLKTTRIRIASDVTSPLLGPEGAVAVFAPQKGASKDVLPVLESGLASIANLCGVEPDRPGDGAAGGMGYGLRAFLGASTESGAELALHLTDFRHRIHDADFVITGEGCTDSQTEAGKLCFMVSRTCRSEGIPCVLLSGAVTASAEQLASSFFASRAAVSPERSCFSEIAAHAEEDLRTAAAALARDLQRGNGIWQ